MFSIFLTGFSFWIFMIVCYLLGKTSKDAVAGGGGEQLHPSRWEMKMRGCWFTLPCKVVVRVE